MLRPNSREQRTRRSPCLENLEDRMLLTGGGKRAAWILPMTAVIHPQSVLNPVPDGAALPGTVRILGRILPNQKIGLGLGQGSRIGFNPYTPWGSRGWIAGTWGFRGESHRPTFRPLAWPRLGTVPTSLVGVRPLAGLRPFQGSPTPPFSPFTRLIPNSVAYAPGLPARPDPRQLSIQMAEDPAHPAYSSRIELGLVFLGQFIDHDLNLNDVTGQGPTPDPNQPLNVRTPALDLDTVYGKGPHDQPEFYTPDGLFFRLGSGGSDLLRDANGVAIIGDPRNDDNAPLASIHLAFQKYHNLLMTQALHGTDPASLTPDQKDVLFGEVHALVIGTYQGIVTHQFAVAITGRPISDHVPPLANIPLEFSGAVFRLGHSLVPNQIVVDHQGTLKSPTDPSMRGPGAEPPYDLLFGPKAQPAAGFDAKISDTMRELLIPLSPTDPSQGSLIGGNSPNLGAGHIIDGVMHLDLVETNIMRGRELHLPSGEEYLAHLEGRPYDPVRDGNTDLFVYILHEAAPLGHLGKVGTDVVDRAIGGTLANDPFRYDNPALFSPQLIDQFRHATMEGLLHAIGAPGF